MSHACTSEPISWLRLERFALGELGDGERRAIAAHLDECRACHECLDTIRESERDQLPALPALPVAPARVPWWKPKWVWAGLGTAAVAAAAVAIVVIADPGAPVAPRRGDTPPARIAVKGGAIAIELVRERGGSIAHDPSVFEPSDRFKVLFTCPPGAQHYVDVAVYQDGEASFPLAAQHTACGNRVTLPGAFRITGATPATVCAVFSDGVPPSRDAIRATSLAELDRAVCVTVAPAR
jgi:hypothetical protein